MNVNKSEKPSQPAAAAAKITEIGKAQPKDAKPENSLPSQREAVFTEITKVLREDKVSFDGSTSVKAHLTEERMKKVYEGIAQGFRARKIALKDNPNNQKKLADAGLLKTYIIGLVNNWVRRDPRLNGKPQAKKN